MLTRSVTNKVVGGIVSDLEWLGGSLGGSIGRVCVVHGGLLRR